MTRIILGISAEHDAGAVLMIDGEVVAAVNEERLSRQKLTTGYPERAIECVLRLAGVERGGVAGGNHTFLMRIRHLSGVATAPVPTPGAPPRIAEVADVRIATHRTAVASAIWASLYLRRWHSRPSELPETTNRWCRHYGRRASSATVVHV